MNKCSPENMRKALKLVDTYRQVGIDFVPVPVLTPEDKENLVIIVNRRLDQLANNDFEKLCNCCARCQHDKPCAGVMAAGPCDDMCNCEGTKQCN